MRLNRYLAAAGLGSRRGCEQLISEGRVTLNGEICTQLATQIGERDAVKVNGKLVQPQRLFYVLLNKPRGYVCTARDPEERRTVFALLPRGWPRLFHVGRLDKESEGLLILTNDGELSLRLTHPRFKVEKEYEVTLDRSFELEAKNRLLHGVHIGGEEGSFAKAESIRRLAPTRLQIVLRQGLKRQIRMMLRAVGYEVERLVRTRIGPLRAQELRPGEWRFLTGREVERLKGTR